MSHVEWLWVRAALTWMRLVLGERLEVGLVRRPALFPGPRRDPGGQCSGPVPPAWENIVWELGDGGQPLMPLLLPDCLQMTVGVVYTRAEPRTQECARTYCTHTRTHTHTHTCTYTY